MVSPDYVMRSVNATPIFAFHATPRGLAPLDTFAIETVMFDRDAFLAEVLRKAGSKAEIARALDVPSSRVAELFREAGHRQRTLTMVDGIRLAQAFDIPLDGKVSAARLKEVLKVCLRYPPKGGWTDQAVQRLAEGIEYGLGLLGGPNTNQPSQDAIDLVARVIADRLRDKPGQEDPSS